MLNLFDFSLSIKGFPLKEAVAYLQRVESLSEKAFAVYLEKQKRDIAVHHLSNTGFYKVLAKSASPDDWGSLPVMTKSDLQQPLKNRLSSGFSKQNVYINKTSGSSGHPFIFAKDRFCHALTWAVIKKRFQGHGIELNTSLQARFYGIPLDFIGYQKERLKDRLSNRYRFPVFDLSDEKLEQFYHKFSKTPFDYINGYTSSIVLFAKYLEKKGIILKSICPSLKVCMVTSEMLFKEDQKLLQKQLGVPVVNEYGASELDLIAFTDIKGDFVVNCETLFVEILDEQDRPLPLGQTGRIVVTSLYNKAHPFLRYDIGDVGALSETSRTQKPLLKTLVGRTSDVAILPNGKKVAGLTFYYVTKSIIEDSGNVKEFVVAQTLPNRFEITYVSENELSPADISQIKKALATYLESTPELVLKRVSFLDRSRRGKLKQFTSFVNG